METRNTTTNPRTYNAITSKRHLDFNKLLKDWNTKPIISKDLVINKLNNEL